MMRKRLCASPEAGNACAPSIVTAQLAQWVAFGRNAGYGLGMTTQPSAQAKFTTGSTMRHVLVMTSTASIGLIAVFAVDIAEPVLHLAAGHTGTGGSGRLCLDVDVLHALHHHRPDHPHRRARRTLPRSRQPAGSCGVGRRVDGVHGDRHYRCNAPRPGPSSARCFPFSARAGRRWSCRSASC